MTDLFSDESDINVDPNKNYLEELVGEGKKFKTPEDLARGKAESDSFIERLQKELHGLRNELKSRLQLEEVVDRISSASKSPISEQPPREPDNGQPASQL